MSNSIASAGRRKSPYRAEKLPFTPNDCLPVDQKVNSGHGIKRDVFPLLPTAEYDRDYFLKMTTALEASIPYLYADSKGNITVGIGCLLPNAKAAQELGFVHRDTRKPATKEEIAAQFNKLNSLHLDNVVADDQEDYTNLDLPDEEVSKLVAKHIRGSEAEVSRYFGPTWLWFPAEAKMAFIGMDFAAGWGTMLYKYMPILLAGAKKEWLNILYLSRDKTYFLPGASNDRRQWTRELFAKAVDSDATSINSRRA